MKTAPSQNLTERVKRLEQELSRIKSLRVVIRPDQEAFAAQTDPVLAELWDNPKDAAYDQLASQ